jgi:hypothetical protein
MSTSATLPSTVQIRPSRLAGLLGAVVIVTIATTWSVSQVTTESRAGSSSKFEAATGDQPTRRTLDTPTSQRPALVIPPAYVDSVVALDAEQRAAIFGNLYPTQQFVQGSQRPHPRTAGGRLRQRLRDPVVTRTASPPTARPARGGNVPPPIGIASPRVGTEDAVAPYERPHLRVPAQAVFGFGLPIAAFEPSHK